MGKLNKIKKELILNTFEQFTLLNLIYPFLKQNNLKLMFLELEEDVLKELILLLKTDDFVEICKLIHFYFDDYINSPDVEGISYPSVTSGKFITMYNNISYLLKPVNAGMIKYEDLKTGLIKMVDIKLMNDYLDVLNYNEYIANKVD